MPRTVISLDPDDKTWLDKEAKTRRVPMTQIVREAVRSLRQQRDIGAPDFDQILRETVGIWKGEDGMAYQRAQRAEWDRSA
jgi:hypothetical protein